MAPDPAPNFANKTMNREQIYRVRSGNPILIRLNYPPGVGELIYTYGSYLCRSGFILLYFPSRELVAMNKFSQCRSIRPNRLGKRDKRRRNLRLESLEGRRVLAAVLSADFTDSNGAADAQGFTSDGGPADEWHLSTGRGNEAGHSADTSFYFGSGENAFGGGSYGFDAVGTLTSPSVDLTTATSATLSFNHFLEVEESIFDVASVRVVNSAGTHQIGINGTEYPDQTTGFESVTLDLTPYVGESIQIQFHLDADNFGFEEGWYIDDVVVDVPIVNPNAIDFSDSSGDPDAEGFTTSGPANEWHLSTGRGNNSGHSADDSFYFGANETAAGGGSYSANADGTLLSPSFDLTGATAPQLTFNHFLETDIPDFHQATVSIIHSGGTTIIGNNGSEYPNVTTGFESVSLDLSAYIGESIQVAFRLQADFVGGFEGWYVDDFGILGLASGSASDFGDAPSPYPTLSADNGASHTATGPRLGPSRDSEPDAQPSAAADGDGADEDGVQFGGIAATGSMAAVNILLENAASGQIDAWIDFNRDNDWDDPGEKILDNVSVNSAMQTLNYPLPSGLTEGETFARVRLSSAGGLGPTGPAADGEVEDYVVRIAGPPQVESVVINNGESQRSGINSVQVTFDNIVDIDLSTGDVFAFVNNDTGDIAVDVPLIDNSSGKTVVNITFDPSGPGVNAGGGLEDGDHQLTIDATRITLFNQQLDGNESGTPGTDYVFGDDAADDFFRKYGDQNGNGVVDLSDFSQFRLTFGQGTGSSGFLEGLDFEGDGVVSLSDFSAFRLNFGT